MNLNNKHINKIINESVNNVLNELTYGSPNQGGDRELEDRLDKEITELFKMIDNKVKVLNNIAAQTDNYKITRKAKFVSDSLIRTADIIDHKLNGTRGIRY